VTALRVAAVVVCPDCQGAGQYSSPALHPDTRQPEPIDCRMCETTGLVEGTLAGLCVDCGCGYWLHPADVDAPGGPCPDDCGRCAECSAACPEVGREAAEDAAYDAWREEVLTR
jgi:hypothetical protein